MLSSILGVTYICLGYARNIFFFRDIHILKSSIGNQMVPGKLGNNLTHVLLKLKFGLSQNPSQIIS